MKQEAEILYQCPECGLHYTDEELAATCKKWCSEHKSCNLEITKFSIEAQQQHRGETNNAA